jgi:type VI protein secretion system component Hcp
VNAGPTGEVTGSSRRDVLRGGAIGVGALMGAMSLLGAEDASAQQLRASNAVIFVGFAGINLNRVVEVQSFELGGFTDAGDTLSPSQASLVLESTKYSPALLKAYAEHQTIPTIVVRCIAFAADGQEYENLRITLNAARIVSYHAAAAKLPGRHGPVTTLLDTLLVGFGGITVKSFDTNVSYTWTLPT